MTRRGALAALAGCSFAQTGGTAVVRPRALREGDTVGLITPATYVADPDRIAMAERTVRHFGLKPRFGRNVRRRSGYLGGTVEERVADLHAMFADREVKGIFCIRGGYGSAQLLDHLDYKLIAANPKVFLGYSDITSLHLAIHRQTGLVTFHGPVMLSDFTAFTQGWFRRALFEAKPLGAIGNPTESNPLRPAHTTRVIRNGRAKGRLIGGNLSLIAATMGTPYEIETTGRILFLEDVGEQPYSIDRMLTQLRLSGKLSQAAGIVFGECTDCRPREYQPSFESTFSLGEVLDDVLGGLKIPVLYGLTIGHTGDQLTLPIGVEATLDAEAGQLVLHEPAVIS